MYKVLIIFIPIIIITFSLAYTQDDNPIELNKIVVTATRVEENPLDVPQSVTIINEKQIEESGAKNIADLLNKQAGIQVSDYGPEGAQKTISIRGSTSAQVLVLIDGVRINNSQSGGVDLSLIPLDNIERIEIVRGGNSSIYGADAVGGVINIITKKKESYKFNLKIDNIGYLPQKYVVGYGTSKEYHNSNYLSLLDTQKITIGYYPNLNNINLINIISFTRASNGYYYTDNNYENRKRDNANLISGNITTSIDFPFKSSDLTVKGNVIVSKKGVPGTISTPSLKAKQEDRDINTSIHFKANSFLTDTLDLNITTYYQYKYLHYYDPEPSYQSSPVNSTHKINRMGINFFQNVYLFDLFTPLYGVNLNYDSLNSTDLNKKERLHIGIFTESPIDISTKLSIIPALRYDYYSDFKENINFSIGATYRLTNNSSLKLYLSKSYRVPTFNDMYWPENNVVAGNPNLKPETGYSFEIGYLVNNKKMILSITPYIRYIQNVILWLERNDNKWRPSNYGEALYPGIEFQLSERLTNDLFINLNYTYLYSYTLSGDYTLKNNKRVPYTPVHKLNSELKYKKSNLVFSIQEQYTGKRYTKTTNEDYLDSYFITNLLFNFKLSKKYQIGVEIYNLFNEMYELEPSYPLPGTSIKAYYKLKF